MPTRDHDTAGPRRHVPDNTLDIRPEEPFSAEEWAELRTFTDALVGVLAPRHPGLRLWYGDDALYVSSDRPGTRIRERLAHRIATMAREIVGREFAYRLGWWYPRILDADIAADREAGA